MKFQVPQFIDVEDKIFGPFTAKQFIYLAGGGGLIYVIYRSLPFLLAILVIAPVAALTLSLAFYKINNRPFIETLEAGFKFFGAGRLYIWQKKQKKLEEKKTETASDASVFVPKLSESKLKDIAWSLDVQESIYAGQENERGMKR